MEHRPSRRSHQDTLSNTGPSLAPRLPNVCLWVVWVSQRLPHKPMNLKLPRYRRLLCLRRLRQPRHISRLRPLRTLSKNVTKMLLFNNRQPSRFRLRKLPRRSNHLNRRQQPRQPEHLKSRQFRLSHLFRLSRPRDLGLVCHPLWNKHRRLGQS